MNTARRLNITMQFSCGQMLFRVAVLIFGLNFYTHISAEQVPRYVYRGCYRERFWPNRAFSSYDEDSKSNSLEWCTHECLTQNKDYTLMGVVNGDECYCGSQADDPTRHGLCSRTDNGCECDHQCPGNEEQICGGDWALSIFYISWEDVTTIPSTAPTNLVTPTTETLTASTPTLSTVTPKESSTGVMRTNHHISVSHHITNHSTTTTTSSANFNRGQNGDVNDIPVIAGGTASGVVIIILSVCLIVYLIRKKRRKPDREQNGDLQNMSSVGPDKDTYTGLDLSVDISHTYSSLHLPGDLTRKTQQEAQSTYETLQSGADDYYNIRTYATLAAAHTSTFSDFDNYENTNAYVNK